MTALPPASQLGVIQTKDGYRYQLTPDDLLWLARSVQYEGGDPSATIWTYTQLQAKARRTGTLASLVRAHSQPINPLWDEATDEKCIRYPDRCTPAQLERRLRARTATWESLREDIRSKIVRWATARLSNPVPRAVDFADPRVSQSFIDRNPGTVIVKAAGNWYLATPDVLDWPADFVTVRFGSRIAGPAIAGVGLLAVGALAVGGFAIWTIRRARRRA